MADKSLEEELFETVYQWGRVGIVVNYMAQTYQRMVNDIRADEANKARTLIWGIGYDNDPTALQLREQLWKRIDYLKHLNQESVSGLVENEPLASQDVANKPKGAPTSVNRENE